MEYEINGQIFENRRTFQILKKFEMNGHIFEKHSNIKLHENPSSGSRVVQRGQTARHDETSSRF